MANLFKNDEKSDFKIICQGKSFPCLKVIIGGQSDVFNAMLESNLLEAKEGQVEIEDVSSDTMETLLKFMYQGKVDSQNIDVDLLLATDRFNIQSLLNICVKHFKDNLTVENAMEVMVGSYLVKGGPAKNLFNAASHFARKNKGDLVKTSKWFDLKTSYPDITSEIMDVITFKV